MGEVFIVFLRLGCVCFGGPVAHLGYFRTTFVTRRRWLDEAQFAELVGLCQFLPGPGSSQTGFAIGLLRAGLPGALAAWAGFTLPSAAIMLGVAAAAPVVWQHAGGVAAVHGLQLAAVAIVAQAVYGMARRLCPDPPRLGIAIAALTVVATLPSTAAQLAAIATGAAGGLLLCRADGPPIDAMPTQPAIGWRLGGGALVVFGGLLLWALLAGGGVFGAFYRAGALVFGGGHVVLPLLRQAVVTTGWIDDRTFLAGYGAAQALPGPLFTFAGFLGAVLHRGPGGLAGGVLALVAIFLPGLLLLLGVLPFWGRLRRHSLAWAAVRGSNAAVVGLLAASLWRPVIATSVRSPGDAVIAAIGCAAVLASRAPALAVVAATVTAAYVLAAVGGG